VPQQLDAASAEIFSGAVKAAGIETILGHTLKEIGRQAGAIASVVLDDDRELKADLVIVGVGVRPNVELAAQSGLRANRGLLVDERLQASLPDVFAAGDVVETTDVVTGESIVSGIWTNAVTMGRVAGDNMAGGSSIYEGACGLLNAMELGGLPVISVGDIHHPPGDGVEVFAERRASNYRKLVFRDHRLIGLVLVGEIERAGLYQTLIRERADVSALRRELLGPKFHYGHYLHAQPERIDRYVMTS
jgi:NAD(P)H-nitrite reductase large subunit